MAQTLSEDHAPRPDAPRPDAPRPDAPRPDAPRQVALLPWGDVIEDFLDPIGCTLDDFTERMTGGWLFGYAEALATQGTRTTIIVVSRDARTVRDTMHTPTGTPIVVLPAPPAFHILQQVARGALTRVARSDLAPYVATPARALDAALRRHGCDAILCQEYEWARMDACIAAGSRLGLPVFATFQGGSVRSSRVEWVRRSRSMRRCAGVVIAAAPERQRVQRAYALADDRIAPVPNPLDLDLWFAEDRQAARRALDIANDTRLVVWHGRVEMHRKGLDVLLDAWDMLTSAALVRPIQLLLVGTGADASEMSARLDGVPSVRHIDSYVLDRPAMRRYLSAADLYVLPSRVEGQPVALMEAMACGLPVVAARASGVEEVVGHGNAAAGRTVATGDAAALAGAMRELLENDTVRHAFGARARARIVERCGTHAVGRALHDFMAARIAATVR